MDTRDTVALISRLYEGPQVTPTQVLQHSPDGPHEAGQQLDDTLLYLVEHATNDTTPPEGSFHAVLNQQPPHVRLAATRVLKPMVQDGPQAHGANPAKLQPVLDRLVTEDTCIGLQQRMGTDADRSPDTGPPSLTETLDAAFDLHGGTPNE